MNVNSPYVNGTPVNVNGLGVNGIPVNVRDPNVDENQTNWTPSHNDFPHYQISFLGYLGPFSSAHLLLPTLNLSLVCVIAQVPYLSRQITRAQKHRTLSDEFGTTPLQGRTALFLLSTIPIFTPLMPLFSPGGSSRRSHRTTFSETS